MLSCAKSVLLLLVRRLITVHHSLASSCLPGYALIRIPVLCQRLQAEVCRSPKKVQLLCCCTGMGKTYYTVEVIGDFPAEEAREFYNQAVGRASSDTDWQQVHEVSSGARQWL